MVTHIIVGHHSSGLQADNIRLRGGKNIMDWITQLCKALSEEILLRIIALLCYGELCICDLAAVLDLLPSPILRHIAYLKNTGCVTGERRGVWMYYRLAEKEDGFHEGLQRLLASYLSRTNEGVTDKIRLAS